jgi:N-acetylmuramoyl-L-alanine amidase
MSQQQRTIADQTLFYTRIVERYAHFFERPEVRLRFLHRTLAKQANRRERLQERPRLLAFLQRFGADDWLLEIDLHREILKELNSLLPTAGEEGRRLIRQHKAPLAARLCFSFYRTRRVFYAGGLAVLLFAFFGFYSMAMWSVRHANTYLAERYKTPASVWPGAPSAPGLTTAQAAEGTKYLPDYRPEKVWLVERKETYERYSNGGRIQTDYETDNHGRGYYRLPRDSQSAPATTAATAHHEPVGILYHTSESDLIPFIADNNNSIELHTRELLEYARRHKSYNYVIDRYGQIYRIVRDEQAADHAGHSVWADRESLYVGLNESFLGVCFETSTKAGADEQLTEAQLIAGRLLTAILRSRYQIDDTNCVTHGLVSINPGNMLIGYHHDWIRNFPFEAMGLSDKYKVAPASIGEFGFTYDGELLARLDGVMWPGVQLAEAEFQRRVADSGLRPEELRRRMRDLYREQLDLTARLRHETTATATASTSVPPARDETDAALAHPSADKSAQGK